MDQLFIPEICDLRMIYECIHYRFVQAIVEVFRANAHKMDVLRMLTRVNNNVCTQKSNTGAFYSNNKRQVCSIVTQLRYELFLYPPNGPLQTIKY